MGQTVITPLVLRPRFWGQHYLELVGGDLCRPVDLSEIEPVLDARGCCGLVSLGGGTAQRVVSLALPLHPTTGEEDWELGRKDKILPAGFVLVC